MVKRPKTRRKGSDKYRLIVDGDRAIRKVGRPRNEESELSLWLDDAGVSRRELAEHLGLSLGFVDKLCRGEKDPSFQTAWAIQRITKGAIPAGTWDEAYGELIKDIKKNG